jgi:GrpB-like predicted nucleotidyltransferase (UPF0157 family)
MVIGPYQKLPAAVRPYDPRAAEAAQRLRDRIESALPGITVEHIGSTSVPGCAGRGVIDLQVLYPPGQLAAAREALDALGFQRQQSRDPWPEERPMRVGSVEHAGALFQIHVIGLDDPEVEANRRFRDRLRADPQTVEAYVARKRAIVDGGVRDATDYSYAKGDFIREALTLDAKRSG